ncbi:DUF4232 domain-containing protein [Streptomyces sp. NPDC051909]|uniref:DUF4232 domain-containing protein n=1 Tax=Streptomyces sp. NPDC051909 TaxID=3154944 RepID=UPI00343EB7E8
MTKRTTALPVLAATALLLAACGPQPAGLGGVETGGRAPGAPSARPVDDPGEDGVRITSLTLPPPSPSPSSPSSAAGGPVTAGRLPADSGISAAYEVTNTGSETLTYTAVFTFTDSAGGAMSSRTVTVRDVGPGRTVRGTVRAGELPPGTPRVTGAKVLKVTKVPAGEDGACPPSGVRVYADQGDAAMGLRVVGLHLENCGTRDYTVEGYPLLELLDSGMKPVDGITVLKGSGQITTGAGPDEPPRRVVLRPTEAATASLVWRNTTEAGTAVTVPHVRVRAKAGADPVTVTPDLDLGTTGRLGVRPWRKAERPGASAG